MNSLSCWYIKHKVQIRMWKRPHIWLFNIILQSFFCLPFYCFTSSSVFPPLLPKDTLGGHFDASQALVGELSQFNLWDRVLKPAEVAALADCSFSALGNIAPWTDHDVDVYGGATKESLDPCHATQRSNPSISKQWWVTGRNQERAECVWFRWQVSWCLTMYHSIFIYAGRLAARLLNMMEFWSYYDWCTCLVFLCWCPHLCVLQ